MRSLTEIITQEMLAQEAAYHRGMHDALLWIANQLAAPPTQNSTLQSTEPSIGGNARSEEYRDREPTKRPVLDLLRENGGAMTITEIMVALRQRGSDPIRPSVTKALGGLVQEGLVDQSKNGRYRLTAD